MAEAAPAPLLAVQNLCTQFQTAEGTVTAVDDVSFEVAEGEILGLVGESGSGKSVTALSLLRLVQPPGRIAGGAIEFRGRDLLRLPERAMRRIRGNEITMVFQEPMSALNPIYTIGEQVMEPLLIHKGLARTSARRRALELLERVGIPYPHQRLREYPHQLSGGLRQRVVIAMALACEPKLLIADEPTTALDVTIQAQIMDLLRRLQQELGMAIILITHDLGVVAEFVHKVHVMYAGRIVEKAPVEALYNDPRHPYAEALLASIPKLDGDTERLVAIEGTVPSPFDLPTGCPFAPRCRHAAPACARRPPELYAIAPERAAACIRPFGYTFPDAGADRG